MTYYLRGGRYYVGVPTRSGRWIKRATGTGDRTIAKAMERMLEELGPRGRREWEFLDPIATGDLSVAMLYDAYRANDLDGLRERLKDVDMEPFVESWLKVCASRLATDTVEHYDLYVRSLLTEGQRFPRSELTYRRLTNWLSSRKVGPSTRRKYHAAMSSFFEYLCAAEVVPSNPMRAIKAPSATPPRMRYLSLGEVKKLASAQAEPYRTLSILLHATGIELSVALALKKRDFDILRREVRAQGTKTKARDRIAIVDEWAWPDIKRHIRRLLPNAPLFPGINRWTASDKHRDACTRLEIEDYQLKDSRHTYAVRAIRAGAAFEHVAAQLGHSDTTMVVRVYGRFKPSEAERTEWERIAAMQDKAARTAR